MIGLSHHTGKYTHKRSPSSAVNWAVGFEKVLEDPLGLIAFTEFLKREFSAENIMFWVTCENYRNQNDKHQRKKLSKEIVERHLLPGAPEPVNIDSHTRQTVIKDVMDAAPDLFIVAQKQIFSLMKFDSYQRFLQSELFTDCLTAEKLGKPFPLLVSSPESKASPKKTRSRSKSRDRNRIFHVSKLNISSDSEINKCASETSSPDENSPRDDNDEKKRKSLLPWQKGRGKSCDPERSNSQSPVLRARNGSSRRSKRKVPANDYGHNRSNSGPIDTLDAPQQTIIRHSLDEHDVHCLLTRHLSEEGCRFCRLILPDTSAAVLSTDSNETIEEAIHKLMLKHGLRKIAVEAVIASTNKVVDFDTPLSALSGKEIEVQQRVMVLLELPSKKTVAVKASPTKTCQDVLVPILEKYDFDPTNISFVYDGTRIPLNMNGPVEFADRCKILAETKCSLNEFMTGTTTVSSDANKAKKDRRNVTSRVFEDVIKGRSRFWFDELGILDLEQNQQLQVIEGLQHKSSSFDTIRRNSFSTNKEKPKSRSLYSNRASIHEGMGIKIQLNEAQTAPENSACRRLSAKNVHYRDSCDITRVWNRLQQRLDDQRGTELNCELPEFLKL